MLLSLICTYIADKPLHQMLHWTHLKICELIVLPLVHFFFKHLESWMEEDNSFCSSNQVSNLKACSLGRSSSQSNPLIHSSCSIILIHIIYGDINPKLSNKVAIFFNSKRFIYPVPSSSEIDLYVNISSFAF